MMKFSSMLAVVFAFIAIGSVQATYSYSRNPDTGEFDMTVALLGTAMIILFSILTFVMWRKSVMSKNDDEENS